MSPLAKYYIGAGIGSLLAIWLLPGLISFLVVVGLLGAPVVAWFMLDESQRLPAPAAAAPGHRQVALPAQAVATWA